LQLRDNHRSEGKWLGEDADVVAIHPLDAALGWLSRTAEPSWRGPLPSSRRHPDSSHSKPEPQQPLAGFFEVAPSLQPGCRPSMTTR